MPRKSFGAENCRRPVGPRSSGRPSEQIQESARNLQDSRPEKVRAFSTEPRFAGAAQQESNPRRTPERSAQPRCSRPFQGDLAAKPFQPLLAEKAPRSAKVQRSRQSRRRAGDGRANSEMEAIAGFAQTTPARRASPRS